ncbi:MAG: exodeoxyribonuclease VII large subunit [Candidatus Omnitrophota bacterium]|jgi:exodeoxyribonuclease VII large subunit|nr:exodeoxyribonuclease VII large subunit [Candidatus Omnitrophota bacterium]MDD5517804.1 exodeoxyribonuclease VII large subunit [Candidatus Omnitrophota bacterium]
MPLQSKHIYTVSQITQEIEVIFENTFGKGVWVEGEVSNFKAAASGHFYFSLKDNTAVLAAAMFARANRELKFKLQDGIKVICFGQLSVYGPRGQYQMIVEKIEPKGIGARQLAFEQLKEKLLKDGLFDASHKKPLPFMPFRIGIVTSGAGAAIRDILGILQKDAPCLDVVIRSVRVQGEGAAKEIARGIEELNQFNKVDLIIISRGGGSTEDLWAFNEEAVARAVYASQLPTISAVGHQINISLCDLVADCFVETPTAAAKIIVDKKNALLAELESLKQEAGFSVSDTISLLKNNLTALRHAIKSPLDRLQEKEQVLDELFSGLNHNMRQFMNITRERMAALIHRLDALSPLAVLSRGYSLSVFMADGSVIKDADKMRRGDKVKTILSAGSFISSVEEVMPNERKAVV